MDKNHSQLVNAILIILGGGLLIFQLTKEERAPYILIAGLVLLMFGLYRATNHWSYTKDDHLKEEASEEEDDQFKD